MASIQCSIELHDGVSPVLREMSFALDQFAGQMVRFGEEMGSIAPDAAGVSLFAAALGELRAEAHGAFGMLDAVLGVSEQIVGVFSRDMFRPLVDGAVVATVEIEALFEGMSGQIHEVFQRMGRDTAILAAGLPRYFAGPLGEITRMFSAMAASARASMNSIAGSARAAMSAVSAVNHADRAAPQSVSVQSGGGAVPLMATPSLETFHLLEPQDVSIRSGEDMVSLMAVPSQEALSLPGPEVYWGGVSGMVEPQTTVAVTVYNENHIASDIDAEAVLREMEVRLADAVASSAEGVYL